MRPVRITMQGHVGTRLGKTNAQRTDREALDVMSGSQLAAGVGTERKS